MITYSAWQQRLQYSWRSALYAATLYTLLYTSISLSALSNLSLTILLIIVTACAISGYRRYLAMGGDKRVTWLARDISGRWQLTFANHRTLQNLQLIEGDIRETFIGLVFFCEHSQQRYRIWISKEQMAQSAWCQLKAYCLDPAIYP